MTFVPRQTILPSGDSLAGAMPAGGASPTSAISRLFLARDSSQASTVPTDSISISSVLITANLAPASSSAGTTSASQVSETALAAPAQAASKLKLVLIVSLASLSGIAVLIVVLLLVRKALNKRRLKALAELSAVQPPRVGYTNFPNSRMSSQMSLMVPRGRNPETSTLSTTATLTNDSSIAIGVLSASRRASTPASQVSPTSPKLEDGGRGAVSVSPLPDVEQIRQEALARMLAADPAPPWRARVRGRSRSRRRRAVDGGAQMNGTGPGPQRGASPAPTTVSTVGTCESVGAGTLPPAYARYD